MLLFKVANKFAQMKLRKIVNQAPETSEAPERQEGVDYESFEFGSKEYEEAVNKLIDSGQMLPPGRKKHSLSLYEEAVNLFLKENISGQQPDLIPIKIDDNITFWLFDISANGYRKINNVHSGLEILYKDLVSLQRTITGT